MKISYKKLDPNAKTPTYGTEFSAGADLYALLDSETTIAPGKTKLIKTGIAMEIPTGFVGLIFARSGLATKRGLAPSNKVGVIDSDYRGEIMVSLHNHSAEPTTLLPYERIAQLVIVPYLTGEFEEVSELGGTERGEGGFGSTGRS